MEGVVKRGEGGGGGKGRGTSVISRIEPQSRRDEP